MNDKEAMEALNTLRSEAIATQNAGWSTMMYPFVAILNAAGYEQFDPTAKQIDEYLDCHGGAGGYPGHLKRETPKQKWSNPVSQMEHMISVMRTYINNPTVLNLNVLNIVLERYDKNTGG